MEKAIQQAIAHTKLEMEPLAITQRQTQIQAQVALQIAHQKVHLHLLVGKSELTRIKHT